MGKFAGRVLWVGLAVALLAVASVSCRPREEAPPSPEPEPQPEPEPTGAVGAVFAATNLEAGNGIVMFERDAEGKLTYVATVDTGGLGADDERNFDPLGSQGSIVVRDGRLYTVNAGSNELSVFEVAPGELTLLGTYPSGGEFPVSVAVRGDLLYALNVGGAGNVTGFRIEADGALSPIPESTRDLALEPTDPLNIDQTPSQVGFVPGRDLLLVTEKGFPDPGPPGQIHAYQVLDDGLLSEEPVTTDTAGRGPFGFDFTPDGHLLVVESVGGAGLDGHSTGAVSSYRLEDDGTATVISPSVDSRNRGSCWIIVRGSWAWITSSSAFTITGYRVGSDGSLALLQPDGKTASTGENTAPLDFDVTADGDFLYVLNAAQNAIGTFRVDPATGGLTSLGLARIQPDAFQSLQGLAVHDYP